MVRVLILGGVLKRKTLSLFAHYLRYIQCHPDLMHGSTHHFVIEAIANLDLNIRVWLQEISMLHLLFVNSSLHH